MNPLKQIADVAARPVKDVSRGISNALNRPTTSQRHRPFYGLNVIDMIRGGSLEEAIRDKRILITGASAGIGLSTAIKIGEAGGEVILVARGREKLEEAATQITSAGGRAHVYPCDLSNMDAIGELGETVIKDLGGVDILINNAGRSIRRSLELSYDRFHDYERTMQLNYFAPVRLMLTLLPGMRERRFGHIINVSSIGVQTRMPRFGAYIASKAALDTLSDSWQAETHDQNIRFSTVHMVLVRTKMIEATTIYQKFPTLSAEEAAEVLCETVAHRPRRVSPPFGSFAAFADSISPQIMDAIRNRGYHLFADSNAARGDAGATSTSIEDVTREGRLFAEMTRGTHW